MPEENPEVLLLIPKPEIFEEVVIELIEERVILVTGAVTTGVSVARFSISIVSSPFCVDFILSLVFSPLEKI